MKQVLNLSLFQAQNNKHITGTFLNSHFSDDDDSIKFRNDEIFIQVLKYVSEYKSMILDGFVNFRLKEYMHTIDNIVDYSVNKYVVEKEYNEFIGLLKLYIDSKDSQTDTIHLIYTNGESILLDNNRKIIQFDENLLDTKYMSDISFSSNDYALNTLLTHLPKKIEIHIIGYEDEFINTLKLIFDKKIFICSGCNICRAYRTLNVTH